MAIMELFGSLLAVKRKISVNSNRRRSNKPVRYSISLPLQHMMMITQEGFLPIYNISVSFTSRSILLLRVVAYIYIAIFLLVFLQIEKRGYTLQLNDHQYYVHQVMSSIAMTDFLKA